MSRLSLLLGIAAATFVVGSAQAQQSRVQLGVLECRGGASTGFIVGSVTNLGCVLRADGQPDQPYVATIRKVGLDLGITQESGLAWAVFAPVERAGRGDIAGNYAGAQGSASVGVGVGANVLVGGSDNVVLAAAAQPAGPDRPQRRRRIRGPGIASRSLSERCAAAPTSLSNDDSARSHTWRSCAPVRSAMSLILLKS